MTTPILTLPEIAESQASKYLTHNEALRLLEALRWGAVVKSATTAAEPPVVVDGDAYILPASPTGTAWSTFAEDDVVVGVGGGWERHTPHAGVRHYMAVEDTSTWTQWDGTAWAAASAPGAGTGTGTGTATKANVRFARWTFTATDGGNYLRLSELELISSGVNVAGTGTVTTSGTNGDAATQDPKINNGNVTLSGVNGWASSLTAPPHSVTIELPAETAVERYRIVTVTDLTDGQPLSWTFEVSTDGAAFTVLDTQTVTTQAVGFIHDITLP